MSEALFDVGEHLFHLSKRYNCRCCKAKKSVAWIESSFSWICSRCGTVDRPRTKREGHAH